MKSAVRRSLVMTLLVVGTLVTAAPAAHAGPNDWDGSVRGGDRSSGGSSVLGGNQVLAPISAPIETCGSTVGEAGGQARDTTEPASGDYVSMGRCG